jgi:hypothetical protein
MGRNKLYKYYNPKKGAIIKEAEESQKYPGVPINSEFTFVSLEAMDQKDGRYRIWAGNSWKIKVTKFYPQTLEGLEEALKEFNKYYDTRKMRLVLTRELHERERMGGLNEKIKHKSSKRILNKENKFRSHLSELMSGGQIDLKKLNAMYDEELAKIEGKNKSK